MIELNDNNFKQAIKNRDLVLVDFYATWCGPCNMQSKVLENMKNSRTLDFDIVKVNVDEAPNLAIEYGIDSIPTLIIFKGDRMVKRLVGYTEQEEILNIMTDVK